MLTVEGKMAWLEVKILEWHRIGGVVEVIKVAPIERKVGAEIAVFRMTGIVYKTKSLHEIIANNQSGDLLTIGWKRQIGIERLAVWTVKDVIAARRLLFDFLVLLLVAAFVAVFWFSLHFLHLRPLVLEPNLNDTDGQTGFLRKRFSDFPARLWRHVERSFELSSLRGRENSSRPFGASSSVSRSYVLLDDVIVVVGLREIRLLLQIHPAYQLPSSNCKLLAFLEWLVTVTAHKAIDVVHIIVLNSHHKLVRADFLATTSTLCAVNSVGVMKKIQSR